MKIPKIIPITGSMLIKRPYIVIKLLLYGTCIVMALFTVLLFVSIVVLGNIYVIDRLGVCVILGLYLLVSYGLFRKKHYRLVAMLLVLFYAGLAIAILAQWSINAPVGVLLLGSVIILAGILLGARYIIPSTIILVFALVILQFLAEINIIHPDTRSLALASGFGDVASYSTIFIIVALISWISSRQKEELLEQAQNAEEALAQEKELLAQRLEEKTRSLKESQMQEMRQLYRFAELGQLSTLLLHELANNLNVLTLDINDLSGRHESSDKIRRAQESIGYLEAMVDRVRRQLSDDTMPKVFNPVLVTEKVVRSLRGKAAIKTVLIRINTAKSPHPHTVYGDPMRLTQVLIVLLSNAIDAYDAMKPAKNSQKILIDFSITKRYVAISVTDWGVGIAKTAREHLFKPFYTSKPNGMGVGLYLAKEIMRTHFNGDLTIDKTLDRTSFSIKIPLKASDEIQQ